MTLRSRDASLAWAVARLGQSRRDDAGRAWTPSTTIDDCALFQSACIDDDSALEQWNADNFKRDSRGVYHAGKAGMMAGDLVLYDWDGNGIANHVERVVIPPNVAGLFTTIGANGSDTIAVAYRTRNAYVLGYFRPNYPTTPAAPASPPKEPEMAQSDIDNAKAALYLAQHPDELDHLKLIVTNIYKGRLGRKPDAGGLDSYVRQLALGKSAAWVDASVMGSSEYKRRMAALKK